MQYLEGHFVQLCNGKICNIWRTILYNFVMEKYAIFNNYIMKYYKCNIVIFVILRMTQKTETQIMNFYTVKKNCT